MMPTNQGDAYANACRIMSQNEDDLRGSSKEPSAERILRRLVSEISVKSENEEELDAGVGDVGIGEPPATEQSDCEGSEYSDNPESECVSHSDDQELVEGPQDELLPPLDSLDSGDAQHRSEGPDVPPPFSLPESTYPESNLPPRTGIAIPMKSTQHPFSKAIPKGNEPMCPSNEFLFDEIVRQEAERIAHPELVRNRTVFDSVDVNPENPNSHVSGMVEEMPPYHQLAGPDDHTLLFESRFESGNLRRAVQVYEYEYDLILNPDYNTKSHTQWYFFSVSNTRKGPTYRFNIINMVKPTSVYNEGMRPIAHSAIDAEKQGLGWRRYGSNIAYYQNGIRRKDKGMNYYTLTFTTEFDNDFDTVHFSHCFPYTYTDLQLYLKEIEADPKRSQRFRRRKLCETLAGNACDLLTITSFTGDPVVLKARRAVVLTARVHPGESNASWIMKGVIDYLTGPSLDARILRDNFVFKLVPMLNPDGVIVGNYRCSLAGQDLNRQWFDPSRKLHPTIFFAKNMIRRLMDDREVILFIDIHGHSRKKNIFMYGNSQSRSIREKIFPLLISKSSDCFSFDDCNFKMQRGKECCARVVVYRELAICNSFTLEASFCGADFGPHANQHFNTRHLEEVGHQLCDTILDFCDPDQSMVSAICRELQTLFPDDGASDDVSDSEAEDPAPVVNGVRKKKDRKGGKKEKPKKKKGAASSALEDAAHAVGGDDSECEGRDARELWEKAKDHVKGGRAQANTRRRSQKDKTRNDQDDGPSWAGTGTSSMSAMQLYGGGSDAERWGSGRRALSTDAREKGSMDRDTGADAKARAGKKKRVSNQKETTRGSISKADSSSARGSTSAASTALLPSQGSKSESNLRHLKKKASEGDLSESGDHRVQSKSKETGTFSSSELRDASPAGVMRRTKKCSIRIPGTTPYHSDSPRVAAGAQSSQDTSGPGRGSQSVEFDLSPGSKDRSAVFPPLHNNGRRQK